MLRRNIIAVLLALVLLLPSGAWSSSEITVLVNGRSVSSDVPAQVVGGRTMVPLRFVAEALGADVDYDAATRTVKVGTPKGAVAGLKAGGGIRRIAENIRPSVVGVVNSLSDGTYLTGTGVVLDKSGMILTNNHVIDRAASIYLVVAGRMVDAVPVGADSRADLAVIKVKDHSQLAEPLVPASWGDSGGVHVGDLAVAVGNPLGFQYESTVTSGIISGTDRHLLGEEGYYYTLLQTDAAINRGNSGGPLVDADGQVVGINTLKFSGQGVEGLGFAIPSRIARPIAESLIRHGRVLRPWMGVMIREPEPAKYGVILNSGLTLSEVFPDTPASRSGLQAGDVLVEVAGRPVNSLPELRTVLEVHSPGETVSLKIRTPSGGWREVKIILGERPKE